MGKVYDSYFIVTPMLWKTLFPQRDTYLIG